MSNADRIWECKVGFASSGELGGSADMPMRGAVERTFKEVTGHDPSFTFSGWGGVLSVPEMEVVTGRERPPLTTEIITNGDLAYWRRALETSLALDTQPVGLDLPTVLRLIAEVERVRGQLRVAQAGLRRALDYSAGTPTGLKIKADIREALVRSGDLGPWGVS